MFTEQISRSFISFLHALDCAIEPNAAFEQPLPSSGIGYPMKTIYT